MIGSLSGAPTPVGSKTRIGRHTGPSHAPARAAGGFWARDWCSQMMMPVKTGHAAP